MTPGHEAEAGRAAATGVGARAPGLLLVALAVAVALAARRFEVAFITDPLGPKAFPLTAALLLGGSGVALALRPGRGPDLPSGAVLARMGAALATFVLYAALLSFAGFVASTTLAVWALSLVFGGPRLAALIAALLFSLALHLVFAYALALSLPIGSLWIR
jgi:putative tricarboxylic transport membrane protein